MPRRRRLFARPFTSFADLPLVLYTRDIARLYRLSIFTVWRKIRAGTFHPMPTGINPYTWQKADILADFMQLRLDMRPGPRRLRR